MDHFEEDYVPIIIIGHVPQFSCSERICLHARFTCSANNETIKGVPITKNPEFGLFAFRLTVAPSEPFDVRLQRWAEVRVAPQYQQQQSAAVTGAEDGDTKMQSITVIERRERRLTVYRAWSVVFIEWDQPTQKFIYTNATEPRCLFVGKYPTKKFPPTTNFYVRSSINAWKVNPTLMDGCQFPENSDIYWMWINGNSGSKSEFKMVATIEDDSLNCTIVVWEPLPFMNKVLNETIENTFFIVFSEWGVYDEKYSVIGLDKPVMYDSKEAVEQAEIGHDHDSNPVSIWQRFLRNSTYEAKRGPVKSASDTSLVTVETTSHVDDNKEVVFCTSCGQKDLERELEKLSGKKQLSELAGHVPVHSRFLPAEKERRVKDGLGEMVELVREDSIASKAGGFLKPGCNVELNAEKAKTDSRAMWDSIPYSKQEAVSNPITLVHMCEEISDTFGKNSFKERRQTDLDVEPEGIECGNVDHQKDPQATDESWWDLPQGKSSGDECVTTKTFRAVEEISHFRSEKATKVKTVPHFCSAANASHSGGDPTNKPSSLNQRAEAVNTTTNREVLPAHSENDWLVSEDKIDSSEAECAKETQLRQFPDFEEELNQQPCFQTDLLANASVSDEPDELYYQAEVKHLDSNRQDDIGKREFVQKSALCMELEESPLAKDTLAVEPFAYSATEEKSDTATYRLETCLIHELSSNGYPNPLYNSQEEQFTEDFKSEIDVISSFPSTDISDELSGRNVAENDDTSSPVDPIDVIDLLFSFTDGNLGSDVAKQITSAGDVCDQEPDYHEIEETGKVVIENPTNDSVDDDDEPSPITRDPTAIMTAQKFDDNITRSSIGNSTPDSVDDASIGTLEEYSSYATADTQNTAGSAGVKDKNIVAHTLEGINLVTQDECSPYAVGDAQNTVTSAEIEARNPTARSVDATSLIFHDECSSHAVGDTRYVATSTEIKGKNLIAHSVDDESLIPCDAPEDIRDQLANDINLMTLKECSEYRATDTESVVTTSVEFNGSDASVMDRFPCEEQHFKTYQYFVNATKRMHDCMFKSLDRKSLNDLVPYFESDEMSVSPLPDVYNENLNTNNETLDSVDPPDRRGLNQSYLEYYSKYIGLGAENDRDSSCDDFYSQELPVIPEEDVVSTHNSESDDTECFEYPAAYPVGSKPDVATGIEAPTETATLTLSEIVETEIPCNALSTHCSEDGRISSDEEVYKAFTESAKQKEEIFKTLTESTKIPEKRRGSTEENDSYEQAQKFDDTNEINRKKFEENLKVFRPRLFTCPDSVTPEYVTLCESPPPSKDFCIESGECYYMDDSESIYSDPDDACTGTPCDSDMEESVSVDTGTPTVKLSINSSCGKFLEEDKASGNPEVISDPATKLLLVHTEGEYQIQQPMNWNESYSSVKTFDKKWKVTESGESNLLPPPESECFKEYGLRTEEGVWQVDVGEESDSSEETKILRDLKDFIQTAENSLKVAEDGESEAVFRPQLTLSTPKLAWDEARRHRRTAEICIKTEDSADYLRTQNQSDLPVLEYAQCMLETEREESVEISDGYSYPKEKVFRVPKCVLKGIVNYEDDYEAAVTLDETYEAAVTLDETAEMTAENYTDVDTPSAFPKASYIDSSMSYRDLPDDLQFCVRNNYEKRSPQGAFFLSSVPATGRGVSNAPKDKHSPLNTRCKPLSAEQNEEFAGRSCTCHPLDSDLPAYTSKPSNAGTTYEPHHRGESCSLKAESVQLPGPDSILHPCLEAWSCSETARNGKPNSFMIESEAQTEEESTGLLSHASDSIKPKVAEGGNAYESDEQVTRYGTAGRTLHSVDRSTSPVQMSGSHPEPEANASETIGNFSLTGSDPDEKYSLKGTTSISSACTYSCNDSSGSVADKVCSADCRLHTGSNDNLQLGFTSADMTLNKGQRKSNCERSAVEDTLSDCEHEKAKSEISNRSEVTCQTETEPIPFEDDWFLDFTDEGEENGHRLEEIFVKDPEFQRIVQGKTSGFSSDQCMDYVLEDDAFEEDSTEEEKPEKGEDVQQDIEPFAESLYSKEPEKEKDAPQNIAPFIRERLYSMDPEKENDAQQNIASFIREGLYSMDPEKENDAHQNIAPFIREGLYSMEPEKEKDAQQNIAPFIREGLYSMEPEKENDAQQDIDPFLEGFLSMGIIDRPPSPFASDWFSECGTHRSAMQSAQDFKEFEEFIRERTTAFEKYYEQVLAGTCKLVRQVSVSTEAPESERELTSDIVFLPGDPTAEIEQTKYDDSSVESVYLTPALSPLLDDIPLQLCTADVPDSLGSEELKLSNIVTGSFSETSVEALSRFADTTGDAAKAPRLDRTSVDYVRRCSNAAVQEGSQKVSAENVPDNQELTSYDVPDIQSLSTEDDPDIPDVSFLSATDESFNNFPERERESETDPGENRSQSGSELPQSEDNAVHAVADCLVKKAIDGAQCKILKTTTSLPLNLKTADCSVVDEDDVRIDLPRSSSEMLHEFRDENDRD